jgi:transcriptional regulator with XRE-family HTH domain
VLRFADRLNLLFRAFLKPPNAAGRREEWSNGDIARVASELGGGPGLTRQYLRMLRTGERDKPSLDTAYAIARAFEHLSRTESAPGQASAVIAYLATDPSRASSAEVAQAEQIHDQLTRAVDLRDNPLIGLVARLGNLQDPESLDSVRTLVERLEEQEQVSRRSPFRRRRSAR